MYPGSLRLQCNQKAFTLTEHFLWPEMFPPADKEMNSKASNRQKNLPETLLEAVRGVKAADLLCSCLAG